LDFDVFSTIATPLNRHFTTGSYLNCQMFFHSIPDAARVFPFCGDNERRLVDRIAADRRLSRVRQRAAERE
jgi:hypothetical protein